MLFGSTTNSNSQFTSNIDVRFIHEQQLYFTTLLFGCLVILYIINLVKHGSYVKMNFNANDVVDIVFFK